MDPVSETRTSQMASDGAPKPVADDNSVRDGDRLENILLAGAPESTAKPPSKGLFDNSDFLERWFSARADGDASMHDSVGETKGEVFGEMLKKKSSEGVTAEDIIKNTKNHAESQIFWKDVPYGLGWLAALLTVFGNRSAYIEIRDHCEQKLTEKGDDS